MEKEMSSAENTEWKPLLVKAVGKTGDAGARMVAWWQTGYPDSRPISRQESPAWVFQA